MSALRDAAALLLILVLAAPAAGDELRLSNGDRLTGTVKRLAGGTLSFETPHGELQVPWPLVTALRLDREMLVAIGDDGPRLMRIDSGAGDTPPLGDIVAIEPPPAPVAFDGGAGVGLVTSGGNTHANTLRLDGELVARRPRDRFGTTAVLNRAEDGGRETARNVTASFKYDRFFTDRLFANGSLILTNDRFRALDLRTALGGGIGYQVWDTPAARLAIDGGLGYVREEVANLPDDSYTAVRESAKLDVFISGERIQAFHHHDGFFGLTGNDNLFFRMQNGVRLALVGGLGATAQLDIDYDRSPAPGRVQTDRNFAVTLGYRF